MSLLEQALSQPPEVRRAFLEQQCGRDTETFDQVWAYVEQENRMAGFLLAPLIERDEPADPFEPGDEVEGRFRIVRKLAEGGMGVVYEGYDLRLDRRIAIKCARPGHNRRLPPEVRNASDISHPNVCKIFEIHTANTPRGEIDFITMEFLDGETLAQRLRRGPIPERTALTIARQLCAGLGEAHARHVIHGDLKSNNVFLTENPDGALRTVITDFGLAQRWETAQHVAQSQRHGGTPDYMAPELWAGQKASVRSDIYALGVILYEVATGRVPFAHRADITQEERFSRKPPPSGSRWNRTLVRCLQANPALRFDSAAEVARSVEPPASRRRMLSVAVAALFLAGATGVVSYRYAVAPAEQTRLAVLAPEATAETVRVFSDAAQRLSQLRGDSRRSFEITGRPGDAKSAAEAKRRFGATHVLSGSLTPEGERWVLRASISDAATGAVLKQWSMPYAKSELGYAPVALAGFATSTLKVPPGPSMGVNPVAEQDYNEGATLVRQRSRTDDSLRLLARAVSMDRDSPLIWAALGEAQFRKFAATQSQSWLDQASESARQAMLRNPDLGPVHRIAGLVLQNSGKYEDATAEFQRAVEIEPADSENYRRLGLVYMVRTKWEEAKFALKKATELAPGNFRMWWDLGALYYNMGDYAEAARLLQKASDMGPPQSGVRRVLVLAYINLGEYASAEREIRTELNVAETPEALRTMGRLLFYQRREREAIPYLEKAVAALPENFEYWNQLGNCYRRAARAADARRAYTRAMQLAQVRLAREPLSGQMRSYVGVLAAYLGDGPRAESEITQALRVAPEQYDIQFNAALAFEFLGKREKALEAVRGATRQTLADMSRWPDLAELARDPRFVQLQASAK